MNYIFPFSWECHHPNWRTHIFQRGWTSVEPQIGMNISSIPQPMGYKKGPPRSACWNQQPMLWCIGHNRTTWFFVPSSLGVSFFEFPWKNLSESHFGPLHFLTVEDGEDDASKTESVLQEGWITVDFAKFLGLKNGGWAPEFMVILSNFWMSNTIGGSIFRHWQNIPSGPIAPGLFTLWWFIAMERSTIFNR